MIVSPAKLAANRANAQKSTGPKSEEGKNICRENAVKHGLSGAGVAIPAGMRAKLEEIIADWTRDFPPHGAYEAALMRNMGLALVRMEEADARLLDFEAVRRQELANSWDDIRADEAAALGERLEKKPDRTVFRLRTTSHGCLWLQRRWEWLREGLAMTCDWTDAEVDRIIDLLGLPRDGRERDRRVRSLRDRIAQAKEGNTEAIIALRSLVDEQIDGLQRQGDKMRQTTDVLLQNLIAGGVWFESNAEARSLRKLMHEAERQFERTWAKIKEIRKCHMLAEEPGVETRGDQTENTAPQLLLIAAKAPPEAPSGAPSPQTSSKSVDELASLMGLPERPCQRTLKERAAWDLGVMKQAVAMGLVDPDRLAPYESLDSALAHGDQ